MQLEETTATAAARRLVVGAEIIAPGGSYALVRVHGSGAPLERPRLRCRTGDQLTYAWPLPGGCGDSEDPERWCLAFAVPLSLAGVRPAELSVEDGPCSLEVPWSPPNPLVGPRPPHHRTAVATGSEGRIRRRDVAAALLGWVVFAGELVFQVKVNLPADWSLLASAVLLQAVVITGGAKGWVAWNVRNHRRFGERRSRVHGRAPRFDSDTLGRPVVCTSGDPMAARQMAIRVDSFRDSAVKRYTELLA